MFRSFFKRSTVLASPEKKPTVVLVGSGWGGACFLREIDPNRFNLVVLSLRNHMVFTPLLPQTCTGTLEFRSICEPITNIQPALRHKPHEIFRTMVFDTDFKEQEVYCVAVGVLDAGKDVPVQTFKVRYDHLVLSHGARPNTFQIPGVEEHAFFLREISEARGIRRRIIQNLMTAVLPTTNEPEKSRLMHIVVVGGGPTGVEFAGDISDFLNSDVAKLAPHLRKYCKVTLVEANEVLGSFDLSLRNYCASRLAHLGIQLKKAGVTEVTEKAVHLSGAAGTLPCGLVVWSTGVGQSTLNKTLDCDKNAQGRLLIDRHLRLLKDGKPIDNAYSLGDCAADVKQPLPTLAAVASRQGTFLAKMLNQSAKKGLQVSNFPCFEYRHLGSMASIGQGSAVAELHPSGRKLDLSGFKAFILWRSAYLTMLGSLRSRLYVVVNWIGSFVWGRDVTYIAEISEAKLWKNLAKEGAGKMQAKRKLMSLAGANKKNAIRFFIGDLD